MDLLGVAGLIAGIGAAIGVIYTWVIKPIKNISTKLEKIDKIEHGQRVLMRAQAQTMEHLISGNNVDELKTQYEKLLDYCINE